MSICSKNKITLLLLFLYIAAGIKAQYQNTSYTLSTDESGATKNYVARDYITMKPGFRYAPSGSKNFTAKIDPALIFPPANNYKTPGGEITTNPSQGGVVGSIPGQFAVSPTGAATYTIPIECPKGINGMQPNISLVYNSQGGNGIAGWGWSINGLSSIARAKKMAYYDGSDGIVSWDASCPLSYDGQRLIVIDSTAEKVECRTVNDTYDRIVGYNMQSWGPEYFKIYTKDCKILTYGKSTSLATYSPVYNNALTDALVGTNYERAGWNLVKVEDFNGNYMDIEYEYNENSIIGNIVKRISYGANQNTGLNPNIMIEFNYEQRPDPIQAYVSGKEAIQQFRLKNIQTLVNGNVQRKYSLKYDLDENVSRLISVNESVNGHNLYNPLIFEYGESKTPEVDTNISKINLIEYGDRKIKKNILGYTLLDVDGDGINELCDIFYIDDKVGSLVQKGVLLEYHKKCNDKWGNNHKNWLLLSNTIYEHKGLIFPYYKKMSEGVKTQFGDFNGDGKLEYIYGCYSHGSLGLHIRDLEEHDMFFEGIGDSKGSPFLVLGNFYGSPISDVVAILNSPEKENGLYKYEYKEIKGQNGRDPVSLPIGDNLNQYYYNIYVPKKIKYVSKCNFTSARLHDDLLVTYEDGKMAVIRNNEKSKSSFSYTSIVDLPFSMEEGDFFEIADMNNDGLDDVIFRNKYRSLKISLNKGDFRFKEFDPKINFKKDLNKYRYERIEEESDNIFFYDVNNDGLLDIIVGDEQFEDKISLYVGEDLKLDTLMLRGFNNTVWRFYISENGNSYKLLKEKSIYSRSCYSCVGDVFGDGRSGWIYKELNDSLYCKDFGYKLNKNSLVKVKNPISGDLDISYKPLVAENDFKELNDEYVGIYDERGNINTRYVYFLSGFYPFYTSSILAVSAIETGINKEIYRYGVLLNNWAVHGFMGFKNTIMTDEKTGISRISYNQILENRMLLVPERTEVVSGYEAKSIKDDELEEYIRTIVIDNLIGSESYNYSIKDLDDFRFDLQLMKKTISDELSRVTNYEEYKYDSYGNIINKTMTNNRYSNYTIQSETYKYKPVNFWCNNKIDSIITKISIKNLAGTESVISKEARSYDLKGNLAKVVSNPGDFNSLKKEYKDINCFGVPEKIEITANGITHKSEIEYSPSGRFVKSKTDILNNKIEYDWDEEKGLLMNSTDLYGTTSYTYDHLNRLLEKRMPDGTRIAERILWSNYRNGIGARYYKYTQTSGQAPVYEWYDSYGREMQRDTYGLNNKKISVKTEYNKQGKLYRISDPFYDNGVPIWATTYKYDKIGRTDSIITKKGITTYEYSPRKTTVTSPKGVTVTENNTMGKPLYKEVNGEKVMYDYNALGLVRAVYPCGKSSYKDVDPILLEYDLQGNRTKITDPDAGVIETKYNGFGDQLWSEQKISEDKTVVVNNNYNDNGLLRSTVRQNVGTEGTTTDSIVYSYDATNHYRIDNIELAGKNKQSFTYGNFDRVTKVVETIGSRSFTKQIIYDDLGREKKCIYPSGYSLTNHYDVNGYLTEVTDQKRRSLWRVQDANEYGQLTSITKGKRTTLYNYDDKNYLTRIKSDGIIDLRYEYNPRGNLEYRIDSILNQREDFVYDGLNRLKNWEITTGNSNVIDSMIYDNLGNIKAKSDLDNLTMNYGADGKPHAISSISGRPSVIPTDSLIVTYTDFKKIKTLREGRKLYTLTYGIDDQRRKSVYSINGTTELTRYYLGNYEEEIDKNGNVRKIHYISCGDGLAAILVENDGIDSLLYAYTDGQGSLTALTDESGNVVERYAFDPWGNRRNPADWAERDDRTNWITNRGYTFHEHLDVFDIINMNGRVYDPLTAMFLSPDPFVSSPENWLGYNRYSYCYNNPLIYTDPSGEFVVTSALLIATISTTTGMGIGNGFMAYGKGGSFMDAFARSTMNSIALSAVSGGITEGIGVAFGHNAGSFWHELARAGAHGVANGVINYAKGGKFLNGFAAGTVSSAVGSLAQGDLSKVDLPMATALAGGVTGGLSISHGKIGWNWNESVNGFGIGYSVGALNHTNGWKKDENGNYYYELPELEINGKSSRLRFPSAYAYPYEQPLNNVYPEFYILAGIKGIFNLLSNAAKSITTVFRAVSQGELEDIAAYGLRNRAGAYETGKLFAPTLEEAAQFGKNNFMFDRLPNTIMKVKVPNSVMQNAYRFGADGMNAISISSEYLQFLKATPLNYSPLIP